jgi:hypothetical protein
MISQIGGGGVQEQQRLLYYAMGCDVLLSAVICECRNLDLKAAPKCCSCGRPHDRQVMMPDAGC